MGENEHEFQIELATTRLDPAERARRMRKPGFGQVFTEHMAAARWTSERSWHDRRIMPYQPVTLPPTMISLHYGQIVFEGLKAFQLVDGSVGVFRPHAHAERFQRSARRLMMPEVDTELFLAAVTELTQADRDWVPDQPGHALYLRPIVFASEASLALRPGTEYQFFLLASVTEGFFNNDLSPVTVWVSKDYSRAAPGGTGDVKVPGNYAGAFAAQAEAADQGCQQVVWLDSSQRRWVEELGGMNIFFVHGSGARVRLSTPPLTGTVLPGVTRDTLLTLAPERGMTVTESRISVDQWREQCATGEITEVFACGTAAGITPVGTVRTPDGDWTVGDGRPGPVTTRLAELLRDIQRRSVPNDHGWVYPT